MRLPWYAGQHILTYAYIDNTFSFMNKTILIAVLIGILGISGFSLISAQNNSGKDEKTNITVNFKKFETAFRNNRKKGRAIVIDVRTPEEFANGHSPVALNIDIYAPDFVKTVEKLDRENSYFLYCNSGNRSRKALKLFEQLGFREVYDLKGGWVFNRRKILSLGADAGE